VGEGSTICDEIDQLTGSSSRVAGDLAGAYSFLVIRPRGPTSSLLLALAIAAGCTWALPLHAQTPSHHGVDLRWDAPAECPAVAEIYRELDRVLSRGPKGSESRRIVASAKIVRTERGLREELHTSVDGRRGVRSFEAPSCESLARATVVFLALMVEPEAVTNESPSQTDAAHASQPQNPSEPAQTSGSISAKSRSQPAAADNSDAENVDDSPTLAASAAASMDSTKPRYFALELGGGLAIGSVPSPNASLSSALGVQLGRYRVALDARWAPRRTVFSSSDPKRGGEFESVSLGLRGCYGSSATVGVRFAGCLGGEAIRLTASAVGSDVIGTTRHETWLQLFGAGLVSLGLTPRLGWTGRIDAGFPMSRREFTIDGAGAVRRLGPVFGRATLHFYANF
jgi:hypothetical protein